MKRLLITVLCLAVLAAAADARGGGGDRSSATATPQYLATAPGARDSQGQLVRSESARREFMRASGYPHGRPGYVVGHIVPLKRGGCDCPANMQWQTVAEAKTKG